MERVNWGFKAEKKHYGEKVEISRDTISKVVKTVARIQIDPHKSTSTGVQGLDKEGLRPHPGIVLEQIIVLEGEKDSVKYTYRHKNGQISLVDFYGKGQKFESVHSNGKGYWNTIENVSDKPVVVEVTTEKEELVSDKRA
ncbi:MAG: hypothetical protein KGH61_04405 [Candidatus Micrarchaeota archaeon]|nr:hypothetical protein [Candidatus Micrarchaeota archaeon]MDE1848160.1 hypothetical protein [Candidatus Micrarchaeota archaeon]MDE1864652.1 hypothetical protein [Candidatus Micrarchaeota archaeon]